MSHTASLAGSFEAFKAACEQAGLFLIEELTEDPKIAYGEMPRFTPEHFAFLHSTNTGQFKRFRAGMEQLLQEGVVQALHPRNSAQRVPLLAAIGPLQFEVVKHRLEAEYNAKMGEPFRPTNPGRHR